MHANILEQLEVIFSPRKGETLLFLLGLSACSSNSRLECFWQQQEACVELPLPAGLQRVTTSPPGPASRVLDLPVPLLQGSPAAIAMPTEPSGWAGIVTSQPPPSPAGQVPHLSPAPAELLSLTRAQGCFGLLLERTFLHGASYKRL